MNQDPRRLKHAGGAAQRLLNSAGGDAPSDASRRRVAMFTSTTGGMARTSAGASRRRPNQGARTFVTWMAVAAAASLPLAFLASRWSSAPSSSAMSELSASSPVIAPEQVADVRAIEDARRALGRRDAAAALAALDTYDRAYPRGAHRAEALALRVRALREAGRAEEATTAAGVLGREYPGYPLEGPASAPRVEPQRP
ncbi:MAG: hypothetical protein EOO73_06105 [Myxococcales bacterium]|nr:MAG: hypothetical protein EOO73_06105 [Myxococcales bacterium]